MRCSFVVPAALSPARGLHARGYDRGAAHRKEGGAGGRGARPGRAALGAYAAGALEEGEAAEVEAHLATCAACRAEADQLGRAAAWLGAGQDLAPPERLRDAVLAAARAHPAGNGEATGPPAEGRRPRRWPPPPPTSTSCWPGSAPSSGGCR